MGNPVFKENFTDIDDVKSSFKISDDELKGVQIIFAWYGSGWDRDSAFVLFEKGAKLFTVYGLYESCFGLEGQWEPEETTEEALTHMMENGTLGKETDAEGSGFAGELTELLKSRTVKT